MAAILRICAVLLSLLLLVSGCSRTKVMYHFSDWLLLNRIDDYFILNASQKPLRENAVDRLMDWHRKQELPRLVAFLTEFKDRYRDGLSLEDIHWTRNKYRTFWRNFAKKELPEFSVFLSSVDEEQIRRLEAEMERSNDYLIQQAEMTEEELLEDTLDRYFDILEEWLGSVDPRQKEQIRDWVRADRPWVVLKIENRRNFQNIFTGLLRSAKKQREIERRLAMWIDTPEIAWTSRFKVRLEEKKKEWENILVKTDALCTPAQRTHALGMIQQYIDDFRDLAQTRV